MHNINLNNENMNILKKFNIFLIYITLCFSIVILYNFLQLIYVAKNYISASKHYWLLLFTAIFLYLNKKAGTLAHLSGAKVPFKGMCVNLFIRSSRSLLLSQSLNHCLQFSNFCLHFCIFCSKLLNLVFFQLFFQLSVLCLKFFGFGD